MYFESKKGIGVPWYIGWMYGYIRDKKKCHSPIILKSISSNCNWTVKLIDEFWFLVLHIPLQTYNEEDIELNIN